MALRATAFSISSEMEVVRANHMMPLGMWVWFLTFSLEGLEFKDYCKCVFTLGVKRSVAVEEAQHKDLLCIVSKQCVHGSLQLHSNPNA